MAKLWYTDKGKVRWDIAARKLGDTRAPWHALSQIPMDNGGYIAAACDPDRIVLAGTPTTGKLPYGHKCKRCVSIIQKEESRASDKD